MRKYLPFLSSTLTTKLEIDFSDPLRAPALISRQQGNQDLSRLSWAQWGDQNVNSLPGLLHSWKVHRTVISGKQIAFIFYFGGIKKYRQEIDDFVQSGFKAF